MGLVPLHVAVIDIGRRENTGWAIDGPRPSQGKIIDECVAALAVALDEGALALGFEAPMFVPLHRDSTNLTRGRNGERDRAFTAPAGSAVLVSGLVVVPYVLDKLRARAPTAIATLDWKTPLDARGHILLFEAFVSHQPESNDDPHVRDAKLAIGKFREAMRDPLAFRSAIDEPSCLNLVGAALLRTGFFLPGTSSHMIYGRRSAHRPKLLDLISRTDAIPILPFASILRQSTVSYALITHDTRHDLGFVPCAT